MPAAQDPTGRAAQTLRRAWPGVVSGDAESVHRARVATRRLREALPVVEGERRAIRRLGRDLRKLTRALGPVRELDVSLALVIRLLHDQPALDTALEMLRQHLMVLRERRRARLLRQVDTLDVESITARFDALARSRGRAGRAGTPRTAVVAEQVRTRIARRAERLRAAIDEAGALYAPEPLHAVRIATKKLRYALELGRTARISGAARCATRLKRFQELLGDLHDWQVLVEHSGRVQASVAVDDERMEALTALLSALEDRCRALHAAFIAQRASLIVICDVSATFAPDSTSTTSA
jgi:CHAD domain-containing protein